MLTRSKAKLGEGDPETGSRRTFSRTMSFAHGEEGETKEKPLVSENELLEAFVSIKAMVELLLEEHAERKKKEEGSSSRDVEMKKEEKGKGVGGDGDPPDTNHTFSHASCSNHNNASPSMPYFKLDVKFELPIYDGELNA